MNVRPPNLTPSTHGVSPELSRLLRTNEWEYIDCWYPDARSIRTPCRNCAKAAVYESSPGQKVHIQEHNAVELTPYYLTQHGISGVVTHTLMVGQCSRCERVLWATQPITSRTWRLDEIARFADVQEREEEAALEAQARLSKP